MRPPAALRALAHMASYACRLAGPVRYLIADAGAVAVYRSHPAALRRTARNQSRLAGGLSSAEATRRAQASFREYARMVIDTVWATTLGPGAVRRATSIAGLEHLEQPGREGKGAVVAMCHHGSWDMAVTAGLARGLRFTTVMASFGPPWLTGIAAWERRRRGLELLSLDRAALGFVHAVRRGRLVGVMVDIPEAGPAVEVTFCRGPVRFSPVAAWLALRTGCAIIPVECQRAGGRYRVCVHQPIHADPGDDETTLTQRLARELEPAVARYPEQWFPFHEVYSDGH